MTEWEPREALLAGPDGLDAYRALLSGCGSPFVSHRRYKRLPHSRVEVGEGQAEAVRGLMADAGFGAIEARRDLAGIERVVVGAATSRAVLPAM